MHHRCRAGGVHLYLSAWSLLRGLLSLGDACLAAGGGGGGGAPRHGSLECAWPTTYSSAYLHSGHTTVCTPTRFQLEQQHYQSCRADMGFTCSKLSLCMQTTLCSSSAHSLRQYKRLAQLALPCCARCAGAPVPSNTHMLCNGKGSIKLRVCILLDPSCLPRCQRVTIPIHPSILPIPVGPGERYQLPSKPGGMISGRRMSLFPGIALLRI